MCAVLRFDYEKIKDDADKILNNIQNIGNVFDGITDPSKVIPESWRTPSANSYREMYVSEISNSFQSIRDSLNSFLVSLNNSMDKNSEFEQKVRGVLGFDNSVSEGTGLLFGSNFSIDSNDSSSKNVLSIQNYDSLDVDKKAIVLVNLLEEQGLSKDSAEACVSVLRSYNKELSVDDNSHSGSGLFDLYSGYADKFNKGMSAYGMDSSSVEDSVISYVNVLKEQPDVWSVITDSNVPTNDAVKVFVNLRGDKYPKATEYYINQFVDDSQYIVSD